MMSFPFPFFIVSCQGFFFSFFIFLIYSFVLFFFSFPFFFLQVFLLCAFFNKNACEVEEEAYASSEEEAPEDEEPLEVNLLGEQRR